MSTTYYIDPVQGNDAWDGLSEVTPKKNYREVHPQPGDSVLFRRGTVTRDVLLMERGEADGWITYGAYGEGDKPLFLGSADFSAPEDWTEESPNLWVYAKEMPGEACNFIFNGGECFGNLRWEKDELDEQGEGYYSHMGEIPVEPSVEPQKLYLYSEKNPGEYYDSIECALRFVRMAGGIDEVGLHHVILQDLAFANGGVHGLQCWMPHDLLVRRCDFRNIGGAVWSRPLHIRYGNCVEFWDSSDDITVEECVFEETYDSCITHQGGPNCLPSQRLIFRNNLFVKYGMAAYEVRDRLPIDTYFDNNICVRASGGFAMQGDPAPRQSEIYPQPMGHHIFMWRIPQATEGGSLYLRNNVFYEAPYGAAMYSIISPEAEAQTHLSNNCYYKSAGSPEALYWMWGGKTYTAEEFVKYQQESGEDGDSIFCDPGYAKEAEGEFSPENALLIERKMGNPITTKL